MNLSKTFLLAILAAPAALVGMEDDAQYQKAPEIFQVLMRAAAKELNVADGLYEHTVFVNPSPLRKDVPLLVGAFITRPIFPITPARIFINKILNCCSFSIKKATIFHEMAHALEWQEQLLTSGKTNSVSENFADTQMIIHLKCFECVKRSAAIGLYIKIFGLLKNGYLDNKQRLELAEKTYGTEAKCPYHRELEKRHASWRDTIFFPSLVTASLATLSPTISLPLIIGTGLSSWLLVHTGTELLTAKKIEQEVADGKLEV